MKKEELKKLNTEQLKKKVKIATVLLAICYPVAIISFGMAFFADDTFSLAPAIGLLVVSLAMTLGRKQIKEELASRENA